MYKAILIVFAGLVLVFGTSIFGYSEAASVPQRVIVTFDHALNEQARVALASHGQVVRDLALINGAVVLVPSQPAVNQIARRKARQRRRWRYNTSARPNP